MKSLILAVNLIMTASFAVAAPCSPDSKGPCAPIKSEETNAAKNEILRYIKEAQDADTEVQLKFDAYLRVRRVDGQAPDDLDAKKRRFEIFGEYAAAKRDQEFLYEEAIRLTSELYHVKPNHEDEITIGEPTEARKGYMAGLKATWRPTVTDSGPDVKLSVRIDGADGPHYSGATELNPLETDPLKPKGRMGITLADGRVYIMKDTFVLAVKKKNLGFLAQVIYHETRHFNRLSWEDRDGKNRSWATADEEERDAYKATARIAKEIFGLKKDEVDELSAQYRDYKKAVDTGVPLADDRLTPAEENTWKNHHEKIQINLDEHFSALSKDVEDETARQLALQDQERAERERLAREEKARWNEVARKQREVLDANMSVLAYRCGYELEYLHQHTEDQLIIGFHDTGHRYRNLHFFKDRVLPETLGDFDLMLAVSRACDDAELDPSRNGIKACNNAPAILPDNMGLFRGFPGILAANEINSECVNHVLDDMLNFKNRKSFEQSISSYQQILRKNNAKRRKQEEKDREIERQKNGKGAAREPAEGSPGSDKTPDCFRNGDPFGCEHKHR